MRTRGSKSGVKNETPKLPETRETLGKIGIFLLLKSDFLHTNLIFFNGFPLSSTAFRFSSTAFQFSSTAFCFPRNPRKSIYSKKYTKDRYSSFVFFATCSPSFVITNKQYLRDYPTHCNGLQPSFKTGFWSNSQIWTNKCGGNGVVYLLLSCCPCIVSPLPEC